MYNAYIKHIQKSYACTLDMWKVPFEVAFFHTHTHSLLSQEVRKWYEYINFCLILGSKMIFAIQKIDFVRVGLCSFFSRPLSL